MLTSLNTPDPLSFGGVSFGRSVILTSVVTALIEVKKKLESIDPGFSGFLNFTAVSPVNKLVVFKTGIILRCNLSVSKALVIEELVLRISFIKDE